MTRLTVKVCINWSQTRVKINTTVLGKQELSLAGTDKEKGIVTRREKDKRNTSLGITTPPINVTRAHQLVQSTD